MWHVLESSLRFGNRCCNYYGQDNPIMCGPDSDQQELILTREGFLRKNIVAVSFVQNCAIHPYS